MKIKVFKVFTILVFILSLATPVLVWLYTAPTLVQAGAVHASALIDSPKSNGLSLPALITGTGQAAAFEAQAVDPAGVQRLIADTGGAAVSISRATGAARFVRLTTAQANRLAAQLGGGGSLEGQATAFFNKYGRIFGISDASLELKLAETKTDNLNTTHLTYKQVYRGVPVFAGLLRVHFDANNRMTAVNGNFIPKISIDTTPSLSAAEAATIAINAVAAEAVSASFTARRNILYVFRSNLARGVPGSDYLVYEVEVSNGLSVREFIYVDAHTGNIVDQISGNPEALVRKVYSGTYDVGALVWQEGDSLPFTGTNAIDINNLITGTKESYDLFFNAFGRDSYDGLGHVMETVNNDPTIACPNANWNGTTTNYCTGVTGDDTVAHEWGHAYTEYTHNLIYQWQPGALNESYSDIWGEVVDLLNGRGLDAPGGVRTQGGTCSLYSPPREFVTVNSPAAIAGNYAAAGSEFGPALTTTGITGTLALVDDNNDEGGAGLTSDACQSITNDAEITGKIALIELGPCDFTVAVKNAQDAGAIAAIMINATDTVRPMTGTDATITIPSARIGNRIGNTIKAQLANSVNVTLRVDTTAPEDSYRWLSGEDDPAFNGAIRDMWNPTCYRHPGKVSDTQYHCSEDDAGGVHRNSGIPNHTFALLVDGGSYNGQVIAGLGLTKTAHIYWRAQFNYQILSSDFADHADALEQSCADLIGTNLDGLTTGTPSGQIISAADCTQVSKALQAVEMRDPPTQCNFQPLLTQNPPALCSAEAQTPIFTDTFETVMTTTWILSNTGVFTEYIPRNWQWVSSLPENRPGSAFFAFDNPNLGNCIPGSDDQSGVVFLISPAITLPTTTVTATQISLAFDHNMSSEFGWDGGNLKISVNGGPFQVVTTTNFIFNAYNDTLFTIDDFNTNPLQGQPGFTGTDGGEVRSIWGQSQVDLANYAGPGDTIQLRFDFGTDGCGGIHGWYVDNVQVNYCGIQTSYLPTIFKDQ